jgi:YHS domain-containing protein
MTTDPICGKPVDQESSMNRVEYQERTYYFCSPECEEVFETDPALMPKPLVSDMLLKTGINCRV